MRTNKMLYEMLESIKFYVDSVVPFLVLNVSDWYLHVPNYQILRTIEMGLLTIMFKNTSSISPPMHAHY